MNTPPRTALLLALAVGLTLAAAPAPAPAAGMAAFRLMNVDVAGSDPVREALAVVLPTGSVVPRDIHNDPPTILPASSGYVSSGFNPDALEVTLGNGEIEGADGNPEPFQAIKLDFGPGGLAAGGKLFFQLKWSDTYNPDVDGLIRLVLPVDVTNLAIETISLPDSNPDTGGGPPSVPGSQVPEPAAVAVWSLAAAAMAGWRLRRRRQAA